MVFELTEPESGKPYPAPAIAAAAREYWNTKPFKPSVSEFLPLVRETSNADRDRTAELRGILQANTDATEVLNKLEEDWEVHEPMAAQR